MRFPGFWLGEKFVSFLNEKKNQVASWQAYSNVYKTLTSQLFKKSEKESLLKFQHSNSL